MKHFSPVWTRGRVSAGLHAFSLLTAAALFAGGLARGAEEKKAADKSKPIAIADIKHDGPVSFEKEVLPLLAKNCLACHNTTKNENSLVLENVARLLKGGEAGPAVVPKQGAASLLLKVASHQAEPTMPPDDNDVKAVAFKPEELGLIKLWIDQGAIADAGSKGAPVAWQALPVAVNPILAVAITPDGQYAAAGRGNHIFIYNVESGDLAPRLADPQLSGSKLYKNSPVAHQDLVQSLAFSPDGELLASGAFREVKLWRRPHNVHKFDLTGLADRVQSIAVSPDGKTVAVGEAGGGIKLLEAATGKVLRPFVGHSAAVSALRFLPGDRLASASADKSIRIWKLADGAQLARIDTPAAVGALAVLADGAQLASGGADNLVRIWTIPVEPPRQVAGAAVTMAASPDKKTIALGTDQGDINLVEIATGKVTKTLKTGKPGVSSLSFSADGSRLATGEPDGMVRVWDVNLGQAIVTVRGGIVPAGIVALSPNGNQAVTGAADGRLNQWKLDAPAPVLLAGAIEAPPTAAAVSADGKQLALGTVEGGKPAILVRDAASGAVSKTLLGHEAPITALAFSKDGSKIVSGSADKTARVWNLADGKELVKFAGHAQAVTAVGFNAAAQQVASGAADGGLKLWNAADAVLVKDFPGHTGAIVALRLTGSNQLHSASADKTLRTFNAADGAVIRSIAIPAPATSLAISGDEGRLAVGLADGSFKLLQSADGKELANVNAAKSPILSLSFSSDNSRLAAVVDKQAQVFDATSGSLLETIAIDAGPTFAAFAASLGELLVASADKSVVRHTLRFQQMLAGPGKKITALRYRPDGNTIFAASEEGLIRAFQTADGKAKFSANHGAPVHELVVSPDGKLLASGGEDKQVKVWNADNGSPAAKPQLVGASAPVHAMAFSSDGQKLAAGGAEVVVFNVATGTAEQVFAEHAGPVFALAAAGEKNNAFVSASADKTVRVWTLSAGPQITGHTQPVTALEVSPTDKNQMFSASADGTVRQFNVNNGQLVRQMPHGGPISALAIRGDGQQLASAGEPNNVKLWNLQNGQPWTVAANQNKPVAEMKGDFQTQFQVAAAERRAARATKRTGDDKAALAEAQKRLTAAAETLKKANEAKPPAAKALADKQAAAAAPLEAKAAADKALEAAKAEAKTALDKADQAKAAADKDPKNADLAKAHEEVRKVANDLAAKTKEVEKKAQEADGPAKKAKQELDAATAANTAAEQAAAAAVTANQKAIEAVPVAEGVVKVSDAALAGNQAELTAAKAAAAALDKPIRTLAYSPDGRQLASGGENSLVRTWDATSGAPVETFAGHKQPVTAVAFTAAGLLSFAADKSATVWNTNPDWSLVRTIGNADSGGMLVDRVIALAFSPDGKLLATGGGEPSRSGELKIWNAADGTLARGFTDAHSDTIFGLEFSPDGKYIASSAADRFVKVFDASTGAPVRSFEGHTHHVLDVGWRADGKVLASAGADNVIKVWDFITGDQLRTSQAMGKEVTSLAFVNDANRVFVSSGDKTVRLVNLDNGGTERNFSGGTDFMYSTAVSADGKLGVAGGQESVLFIWNIDNGQLLKSFAPPKP